MKAVFAEEYLRREVPRHLRGEFLKADGRFTYPRGMYVTCLARMWPLFAFVWWTRVKVRGKREEAMEEYRAEGQEVPCIRCGKVHRSS